MSHLPTSFPYTSIGGGVCPIRVLPIPFQGGSPKDRVIGNPGGADAISTCNHYTFSCHPYIHNCHPYGQKHYNPLHLLTGGYHLDTRQ
jgi:hypothetical protein